MKIRPLFAWYDLWVGAYWDKKSRRLYVLPIPCVGIVFDFSKPAAFDRVLRLRPCMKCGNVYPGYADVIQPHDCKPRPDFLACNAAD